MVVPVLITSCQVSEYLNMGPVIPQMITTPSAIPNALELPVKQVMAVDILSKNESFFFSICVAILNVR